MFPFTRFSWLHLFDGANVEIAKADWPITQLSQAFGE
jgi:hypothetical protein